MNRNEFIKAVAQKTEYSQAAIKEILEAEESVMQDTLTSGDSVKAFGMTFAVVDTAPRKGVNPKTGESIDIPASKRLRVKASAGLKETIKG